MAIGINDLDDDDIQVNDNENNQIYQQQPVNNPEPPAN
jgi:hypothetical protein